MNIGVFLSCLIQLHSSSLDINYYIDATYICIYLLRMNISGAISLRVWQCKVVSGEMFTYRIVPFYTSARLSFVGNF